MYTRTQFLIFYLIIVAYSSDFGAANFNSIFTENPINTTQNEFLYFYEKY